LAVEFVELFLEPARLGRPVVVATLDLVAQLARSSESSSPPLAMGSAIERRSTRR
jgi:hypothetical protein